MGSVDSTSVGKIVYLFFSGVSYANDGVFTLRWA